MLLLEKKMRIKYSLVACTGLNTKCGMNEM